MELKNKYRSALAEAEALRERIIGEILKEVETLPDNEGIVKRISSNVFILNSSSLGSNWSVSYHDFKLQYREICENMKNGTGNPIAKLENIVESGKCYSPSHGFGMNRFLTLNPKVIEHLKLLLINL